MNLLALATGNIWRTAAVLLLAALAAQTVYLRGVQAQRDAAATKAEATEAHEQATARLWQAHHVALKADLQQCLGQWETANEEMADALAHARAGEQAALNALAVFEARYTARSQHCGGALIDAERACAELEGY